MKPKTGTREWSNHSFNCCKGCANSCIYCYARDSRFNTKRGLDWAKEELTFPKVRKWPGVVMFPTSHDFTPGNVDHCLTYLDHLLDAGNMVLVVTKAERVIVQRIVTVLRQYPREQSEIRFTLTHHEPAVGRLWEPNAPTVDERFDALAIEPRYDIRTSVSCEPWLDTIENLIDSVAFWVQFVNQTVWIGHANKLRQRTQWAFETNSCFSPDQRYDLRQSIKAIEARQTPEAARQVYNALKNNPKVRFKDSYQQVLGLAGPVNGEEPA